MIFNGCGSVWPVSNGVESNEYINLKICDVVQILSMLIVINNQTKRNERRKNKWNISNGRGTRPH